MKKKILNEIQIQALADAVPYFNSAVHAGYKRISPRATDEAVLKVYKEINGEDYPINWNCGGCIYNLYLAVGRVYYDTLNTPLNTMETEPILKTNKLQTTGRNGVAKVLKNAKKTQDA